MVYFMGEKADLGLTAILATFIRAGDYRIAQGVGNFRRHGFSLIRRKC